MVAVALILEYVWAYISIVSTKIKLALDAEGKDWLTNDEVVRLIRE